MAYKYSTVEELVKQIEVFIKQLEIHKLREECEMLINADSSADTSSKIMILEKLKKEIEDGSVGSA